VFVGMEHFDRLDALGKMSRRPPRDGKIIILNAAHKDHDREHCLSSSKYLSLMSDVEETRAKT